MSYSRSVEAWPGQDILISLLAQLDDLSRETSQRGTDYEAKVSEVETHCESLVLFLRQGHEAPDVIRCAKQVFGRRLNVRDADAAKDFRGRS